MTIITIRICFVISKLKNFKTKEKLCNRMIHIKIAITQ
jgi:hypothetical protein